MAQFTAYEQYFVEVTNAARANVGSQPLAVLPSLLDASDRHSTHMLENGYFNHYGTDGSTPGSRMADAGWTADGYWAYAENIAYGYGSQNQAMIDYHHQQFMNSSGHRTNLLNDLYSEVGIGQAYSGGMSMVTQNFAEGGRTYITGVVIDDQDGDDLYDVGEGMAGVTVTVTDGNNTWQGSTANTGGYTMQSPTSGTFTVTFSGGGLDGTITKTVQVSNANAKVDGIADEATGGGDAGGNVPTGGPDHLVGTSGADSIHGRAGDDTIEGRGGNDTLKGAGGEDIISGGGGRDNLAGGKHADVLFGENGNDRLRGGSGDDTLDGGEGDDLMFGHDGEDVFIASAGRDRAQFVQGEDTVDLTAFGVGSFAELESMSFQKNNHVHIVFNGNDRLILLDTDAPTLNAGDFDFL